MMRWLMIGTLWVGSLGGWGEPQSVEAAMRRSKRKLLRPGLLRSAGQERGTAAAATLAPAGGGEPAPAGELAVYWALPRQRGAGVQIRATPSRSGMAIGDMRGDTAIATKSAPPARRGDGCHAWREVLPAGYLCEDEVQLRLGYLSDPPPQERATAWQRLRYGVVKAAVAVLKLGTGEPAQNGGSFLRATLRKGDGITVIRELANRVQIYGKQWLDKAEVAVTPPQVLSPLDLQAVPPAQRYMVAWAVPPPGELKVALQPVAGGEPVWVPRYSQLWWTGGRSRPGHTLVYPSEELRAQLAQRRETAAAAQATAFEVESSQLRRVTQAPIPSGLSDGERWIDISLSQQVAVAYVGETPLFASLVSTGKGATPAGSFFIYRKYLTQTMANLRGSPSQYDYREVPYAQFFNGRIGLHAVLWHDLLGHPVSHGCVNLSPPAAEQFFSFTKPELPSGWHTVNGQPASAPSPSLRGTRVVVRR